MTVREGSRAIVKYIILPSYSVTAAIVVVSVFPIRGWPTDKLTD